MRARMFDRIRDLDCVCTCVPGCLTASVIWTVCACVPGCLTASVTWTVCVRARMFDRIRDLDCSGLRLRDVGGVFLGEEFECLQELNLDSNSLVEVSGEYGSVWKRGGRGGRWGGVMAQLLCAGRGTRSLQPFLT